MNRRFGMNAVRLASGAIGLVLPLVAHAQDAGPPNIIWESAGHWGGEPSIAFSPNGQVFATCADGDGTIKLWNASNGAFLRTMGGAVTEMVNIAFTADSQYL